MNRGECRKRRGSALLIILMVILTIVCTPLPSFLPSAHAPPVPGIPRSIAKAGDLNGVPYRNIVYAKGYCFVFYRGTNGYLMYRSSSDGVVWSSETNASHVKLSNDTDNNPRHDYAAFVTRSGDIWIAYCDGRYANLWGPPTYYSTAYTRIGAANDGKASWSTQNSLGTSQGWWGFCFAQSVSGDIYLATTRYTGIWSYVGVYYWIDPYGWSLLDGSSRPVGTPPAAIALTWLPNSYAGKGVVFVMAQHRMGIFQYNCWGAGGKPGWMFGWYNLGYFGKITGLSVRESISLVTANNKVHFAYVPNEGGDANSKLYYAYMKDDGSGWNAETTLDDLGYCSSPSLTVDSSNLYALYLSEYDGVKRVLYRVMNYSSYLWSGENILASGEDNPRHLASTLNSTDISGVITFGVNWWASPDNVRFANLKVGIQVTVSVGRSSIDQGETQTWTASGLPGGAGYIATVRCPSAAIIVGTGTADGSGQASGSFLVGTNIPTGTVSFRVELAADDKIYGETTFTILGMQPIPQEILDAEGELYRAARNAAEEIAHEVANMLGTVGGDLTGIVFRDVVARLVALPIEDEAKGEAMQEIAQFLSEIPGKLGEEFVRELIADRLVNLVGVPFVEEIDIWHEEFIKSTVSIHPGVDLSKIAEDMRTLATIVQRIQENFHKDYSSKFYQIEEWKRTIKDIKYTWGTFGRNQFLMAYVLRPELAHVFFEMKSAVTTPLLIAQEILDLGQAISFTWTYGDTKEQEFRIVKMYTRELVKVQSALETGSLQAASAELISISIPSDITLNSMGNFGGEIKNTGEYGFDARLVIEIRDPAGNVRGPFYTTTITVPYGVTGFVATDIPFVNSPSWIDVDESGTYKAMIYAEYGMLEFERRTEAIEREFVVIDPPFGFDKKIELGPKIKSSIVTFMISVTNPSDSDATVSVTDTIPKELVTSIDDIEFVTPPDEVMEADPVVKWLIRIPAEGCAEIVYRIHSPLDPEEIKLMPIPAATLTSSAGPDQSSVINIGNEEASTQTVEMLLMRLKGTIGDLPASAFSGGEQQADHQRKVLSDRIEGALATLHDGDLGGALISFVNLFSPTTDGEPSIEHWITDEDAQSLLLPIIHNTASFMKLIALARTLAPIVEAGPDQTADEGDMVSLSGSFVGLGPSDAHAIKWDFGDGDGATGTLTPTHAYGDNGVYAIELTVTDDKGREGMDALTIEVSNVEPIADAGSDQEVFAGDIVYFSGSFSDPGWLDTHTAIWDFGDGVMENGAINEVNNPPESTGTITGSHTYPEAQTYAITLKVTDDEGGEGSDTITIKVKPIPATVDIDPDTLNLKSNGKWITAYIELPERYDLNDIGLPTIKLWIGDDSFIAERKDVQNDILMAKFNRQVIADYLINKYIEEGEVTMIVRGKVYNNGAWADFECKDTIRVISKGKGK